MTTLTIAIHFEVNGLRISEDLTGAREKFYFHGHRCVILLPRNIEDFGVTVETSPLGLIRFSVQSGDITIHSVHMIRVEVDVDSDVNGDDLPFGGPHDREKVDRARVAYETAEKIASEIISRYVDRVRIRSRQSWLASSSSKPKTTWLADIRDSAERRLAVGFNYISPVVILGIDRSITADQNREIIDSLATESRSDLADVLLADACYVAWPALEPNSRQAILLAAIACEVKVKDTLLLLATDEKRPLVTLLLENPRDFSMAAFSLFDKVLDAVCGRSLRRDDKQLYSDVRDLFEARNKVAHRGGDEVFPGAPIKYVKIAERAFSYLGEIEKFWRDCAARAPAEPGR